MFLTNEGGGEQQSFTQAAPNELKLGEGRVKVMGAGHRLGGGVGGLERERERGPTTRRGIRAVELQPDLKTIQSGRKY